MASKFGLAGGIPERRVRPIWDAVDSRQYKAALKLCAGLLAKYPNSPYALALKALILERMGKPDEALNICLNAKELLFKENVFHIDDLTLSTLQIVFQRLDRLDLATSCYEHACVKYPSNLEIMMGLFNCYVREYAYVKQQQTAIKMYKVVGEERFLLWAVCSILLQVTSNSGDEKLLALAGALLRKHISSHSLHEPEALLIYISILEQQGKFQDALKVLYGDLGSLIGIEVDKLKMQGRLISRSCDYLAAAEVFQKVLQLCPDDWETFLYYLSCLLEDDINWSKLTIGSQLPSSDNFHACESNHLTEDVFDSRISSMLVFVQKLQNEVRNDQFRGPFLANIEIERRRRLKGRANHEMLMDVFIKYFQRFSHLSCFTSDVEPFLHILTENEKTALSKAFVDVSENASLAPLKKLGQAITLFKIQELFGGMSNLQIGDLEDIAIKMVGMYYENLPLSRDLDPQETMYGEELLTMACNILVQLFWRTRSFGYLLMGIMVLEFGLSISRYTSQYKILLLHMYSYVGALPLAYEWYGTSDVKNILLETVSHHIVPQLLESPLLVEAADLLKEYIKFMDDHFREAADLTFLAYRHRNYSKVIEFVQFKERLQHSCQYQMSRLDVSIVELKQKSECLEDVESVLESSDHGIQLLELSDPLKLEALTFNEDLQARPWWSPLPHINYLKESFDVGLLLLRSDVHTSLNSNGSFVRKAIETKSVLPRLLHLSIQASSSFLKENIEANGVSYKNTRSELKCLLERYAGSFGLSFNDAVDMIMGFSDGRKALKDCGSIIYWTNFAVFLNAWNIMADHAVQPDQDVINSWHLVNNLIERSIAENIINAQPILTSPGSNLPVLVQLITEPCSWLMLIIQSCIRSMPPSGKKKKKSGAAEHVNLPRLQAVRGAIESLSNSIQLVQNWLLDQIQRKEDECVDVLLSHLDTKEGQEGTGRMFRMLEISASASNPEFGDRICNSLQSWSSITILRKIIASQHRLLSEFQKICDSKLKLLESLKQSL